jgi:hypothetical protein
MAFPPEPGVNYTKAIIPIEFSYRGTYYKGMGRPVPPTCHDGVCFELDVMLNGEQLGIIHYAEKGWHMDHVHDQGLVDAIGNEVFLWYE